MNSWHVTWASEGRHPLAPEEAQRRALARAIARVAGDAVALYCIVDDHIHVVLFCNEAERGSYVHALTLAFRPLTAVPLGRAFVRPVRDRGHLEWLASAYLLRQPVKHGLAAHPALWSGSCFADLVGARVLPGLRLRIRDALPRWQLRSAHRAVGLPEVRIVPASSAVVREAGASRLVGAAAFSVGAAPGLRGRGEPEILGRRVAIGLACAAGLRIEEVAWALGVTPDAARRVSHRPVPTALAEAARTYLALEVACARAPSPEALREPDPAPYAAEL